MACGGSETRTQGGGSAPPSTAEESYPRATEVPAVLECVAGHALAPAWREAQPWQRPSGRRGSESVRGRWRRSEECASEKSDERQNQRRAEQLPPNSASSARSSVLAGSPPIEYWNIVGVRTRRLATLAATHTTMRANSQREMGCCCLLASPASPRLSLGARSFLPSPAARHLCTRSRIARCISVRNHCSLVWFVWLQLVWFGFNTHWQLLIISFVCYLCAKLFETCPPRSPWKQRARVSARASAITTRTRTRSRMYNKLQVCNLQ